VTNEDGHITGGETMAAPPEAGHVVAARYLVQSEGRLLMVKRFVSPEQGQQGTVSFHFQVFTLEWDGGTPRWESSSPSSAALAASPPAARGCAMTTPHPYCVSLSRLSTAMLESGVQLLGA